MEKLIKLLNEHRAELLHGNIQNKPMRHYSGYVFGLSDLTEQNCILLVISKKYGFIKWLVDNDKIDFENENYPLKKYYPYFSDDILAIVGQDCNTYEDRCEVCYDKYESLLMLLSISDTPIEDLISYLK